MKPYYFNLLAIIILCALGAIVYLNSFDNAFQFDDYLSIVQNPAIKDIAAVKKIFNFWPTRFITYFSIALNYHFGQLDVVGYHLVNLLIHLGAGILTWWLVLMTFSTPAMRDDEIAKYAKTIAFFAGAIFIAHPIQTQAITYVVQRATSLAGFFYLLSLTFYVKARLSQEEEREAFAWKYYYSGSMLSAIIAMFTKEMTVTLPIMILLYEFYFLRTKKDIVLKQLIPFLCMLFIIPLTMFITKSVDFVEMRRTSEIGSNIPSGSYLLTQFKVIITYFRLLFIPVNQNIDYDYPIAKNIMGLPILASIFVLLLIIIVAIKIFSRRRLISFAIFWFFLTLLPESSIISIRDVIAEHRLYLPVVGYSIFLTSAIFYFFRNNGARVAIIAMSIIVICYSVLTYARNFVWEDGIALWSDSIRKSPQKARPYSNRGFAYALENKFDQAIYDFTRAIQIDPNYSEAFNNRGMAYADKGDIANALSDYNRALQQTPKYAEAYYNAAVAYFLKKDFKKSWEAAHNAERLGRNIDSGFLKRLKEASGREN